MNKARWLKLSPPQQAGSPTMPGGNHDVWVAADEDDEVLGKVCTYDGSTWHISMAASLKGGLSNQGGEFLTADAGKKRVEWLLRQVIPFKNGNTNWALQVSP